MSKAEDELKIACELVSQLETLATNAPDKVVQDVAELGDRESPPEQPNMMLVTADELRQIVTDALSA